MIAAEHQLTGLGCRKLRDTPARARPGADEVGWGRAAIAQVAAEPRVGDASLAIATYHEHLAERVGSVRVNVLHQRVRDEQQLCRSGAAPSV
jgi:hypothetical protein